MLKHTITIDAGACIGCGQCVLDCPSHNIFIQEDKAAVRGQDCIKCGHCVAICPKAAVNMSGYGELPEPYRQQTRLDPQELKQALKTRRSMRQFQQKAVPSEVIKAIIEAGRQTPTAKNAQDISYHVVQEHRAQYEAMAVRLFRKLLPFVRIFYPAARNMKIDDHFFLKNAPVAIVICSEQPINGGLAASNMALMAEAHGLGVLYSGFFTIAVNHSKKLRKALGVTRGKSVTTLVLGYPNVHYHRTVQRENALIEYR